MTASRPSKKWSGKRSWKKTDRIADLRLPIADLGSRDFVIGHLTRARGVAVAAADTGVDISGCAELLKNRLPAAAIRCHVRRPSLTGIIDDHPRMTGQISPRFCLSSDDHSRLAAFNPWYNKVADELTRKRDGTKVPEPPATVMEPRAVIGQEFNAGQTVRQILSRRGERKRPLSRQFTDDPRLYCLSRNWRTRRSA